VTSPSRPAPAPVPETDPETEPYEGGDGPLGVLLVHGFTSTPQSMRPWARFLETDGFHVVLPRLPGHGTRWEELNETAWTDWYDVADRAFRTLRAQSEQVFLAGLSMGAALCLRLAQQHGADVAGMALVNPVVTHRDPRVKLLPILKRLTPSLGAVANDIADPGQTEVAYARTPLRAMHSQTKLWALIRADLGRIDQPMLIFRSEQDHIVDDSSLPLITAGVRSRDTTLVSLPRSYHVATLDYEAEEIFVGSASFFRRLAKD
jgi:carboxylesterase